MYGDAPSILRVEDVDSHWYFVKPIVSNAVAYSDRFCPLSLACENLILILCKTVGSFTEVAEAKPITVNHSIFNGRFFYSASCLHF
jgi:hypothetical protein